MPNRRIAPVILFLAILSAGGCKTKTPIVNIPAHWSSMNPSGIPLNLREKEQQKGNLLVNPSFEQGRYYRVDTISSSFNLSGWKKVGENVYWTNIQNEHDFTFDEASNGSHAVKIVRKKADETDIQGEGIISDYIKVIPGNYELSLDIKLNNIETNLDRLIDNLYDAVNIRLYFFDKNKVMLKSHMVHPVFDNMIDNCFKGVPLSNMRTIDNFGWARLIARAGNFPFIEGYIPSESRYVKVFAGLKGTGTMWVDRLDFRYTDKNFSFLEKTKVYMDSTFAPSKLLIPEPHQAEDYHPCPLLILNESGDTLKPLLLLPANGDEAVLRLGRNLITDLRNKGIYNKSDIPITRWLTNKEIESGRLIFSIGNTFLYHQYADQLTGEESLTKEQGCSIYRIPSLENVIFIRYSDYQGLFRALGLVNQLCDPEGMKYHHYNINDYPDFLKRGVIWPLYTANNEVATSGIDFLSATCLNQFFMEPQGGKPDNYSFKSKIDSVQPYLLELSRTMDFLTFGYSFAHYSFPGMERFTKGKWENDSMIFIKTATAAGKKLQELIEQLNTRESDILLFSEKNFWAALNNGPFNNSSWAGIREDLRKYNSLYGAFWDPTIRTVAEKNSLVYLLPIVSDNRTKNIISKWDLSDYQVIGTKKEGFNGFLWSGPVLSSFVIDDADYQVFTRDQHPPLILFDNTMISRPEEAIVSSYHALYPGVMANASLFAPYTTQITKNVRDSIKAQCILNINSMSDFNMIRLATAADYLWNVGDYDPFLSAWKALVAKYGKPLAIELVFFNDFYYKIISLSMEIKKSGNNQKAMKTLDELVDQLNNRWNNIQNLSTGRSSLLNEVSDFKNVAISHANKARRNISSQFKQSENLHDR